MNRIISISFGADITTWGYIKYITEHHFTGGISQPCPAVVGYIEKYIPELIPRLVPVHSPMMCGAIYVKKYMKVPDKLAFISPCVAKKNEIDDPNCGGYVSYNVTFDHLMRYVREHGISGPAVKDEIEYGLESIYPMPGGLKENVYWFCGEDVFIRQIEGEKHAYEFLEDYKERVLGGKELPFMVDALNCAKGCIYGPGVEEEKSRSDDTLYELQKIREVSKWNDKKYAFSRKLTPKQRLDRLNRQFKDLDIKDFIRHYSDKSKGLEIKHPDTALKARNDQIADLLVMVQEDFDSLDTSISEMSIGNNSNAEESTGISASMSDVVSFCDQLKEALERIQEMLVKLEENNEEITNLAEETNLLALNASIEAARAGGSGGGFAIIAENIMKLADLSKDTASDSDSNKEQIQQAITQLLGRANKLIEVIDGVNVRVTNLAASTEEIAASADMVSTISTDLKEKLTQLNS